MCEICSKVIIKYQNDVIDVALVPILLTLIGFRNFFGASIVDFEQINAGWDSLNFLYAMIILQITFGAY